MHSSVCRSVRYLSTVHTVLTKQMESYYCQVLEYRLFLNDQYIILKQCQLGYKLLVSVISVS